MDIFRAAILLLCVAGVLWLAVCWVRDWLDL